MDACLDMFLEFRRLFVRQQECLPCSDAVRIVRSPLCSIGFELFGFEGVPYILIAISISYMLSGYHGLYKEQIIVYSKYHPKFINRQSGDESFDGQDYE